MEFSRRLKIQNGEATHLDYIHGFIPKKLRSGPYPNYCSCCRAWSRSDTKKMLRELNRARLKRELLQETLDLE